MFNYIRRYLPHFKIMCLNPEGFNITNLPENCFSYFFHIMNSQMLDQNTLYLVLPHLSIKFIADSILFFNLISGWLSSPCNIQKDGSTNTSNVSVHFPSLPYLGGIMFISCPYPNRLCTWSNM